MSLIPPYEREDILLPSATNLIKDLRISPFNSSFALLASLGKKLSVIRWHYSSKLFLLCFIF